MATEQPWVLVVAISSLRIFPGLESANKCGLFMNGCSGAGRRRRLSDCANTPPHDVILSDAKNLGLPSGFDLGRNSREMFRFAQHDSATYEIRFKAPLW